MRAALAAGEPAISVDTKKKDLVGATTTTRGLTVRCEFDTNVYQKEIAASDKEMQGINVTHEAFHGQWDYTIHPSESSVRAVKSG